MKRNVIRTTELAKKLHGTIIDHCTSMSLLVSSNALTLYREAVSSSEAWRTRKRAAVVRERRQEDKNPRSKTADNYDEYNICA